MFFFGCTSVPQNPSSKPLTSLLRSSAKEKKDLGDRKTSELLEAAADTIDSSDENARIAIANQVSTTKENSDLQREAGFTDGLKALRNWSIIVLSLILLILGLYAYIKGKFKIPFLPSP
ncbi:hypothetical protein EHQ99_18125 [Leptospira bouyouniensis]|nr:hypothetical protein EHQ99_18125 [Leptospira bouyouniensis]